MPTYHFRCPRGHDFDRFYKTISTAPDEQPCPECGEASSRQLSGGAGLHFKGSGFYLTDYGKNAHRGAAPEKKTEGAKGDAGKAETAPSKTDAKTETPKPKAEGAKPKPKSE